MQHLPFDTPRPSRNYHLAAVVAACAGGAALVMGDTLATAAFKAMIALPIGLVWVFLPIVFDRQRSSNPRTSDYMERTAIEAILFTLGLMLVFWQPGRTLDSLVLAASGGVLAVVAAKTLAILAADLWLKRSARS